MSDLTSRLGGARTSLGMKAPVRCATTANISLTGFQTIDGVALAASDANLRVLVWNQTDTTENGIYDAKSTAWTRAKDFNGSGDIVSGTAVLVGDGTLYSSNWFLVTTDDPIVIGTTALAFEPLEARATYQTTDVTAAATCDIGSTHTTIVRVVGSATITSLGTVANRLRVVYFSGSVTLTHNATSLILPGGVSVTTQAGDSAIFLSDASGNWRAVGVSWQGWRQLTYATRADLAAASVPTSVTAVATLGYATASDGGGTVYIVESGSTSGGVQSADGRWWGVAPLDNIYNVRAFGAKGDGTTSDSTAINAASTRAASRGGGVVYLPPTGAAYVASNISLGNGVLLKGADGAKVYPGSTATVAQWTATGTWMRSTDTTNPTVTCSGNGSGVVGVNFIRSQVIPSGGAYTPTTFPYEIKVVGTLFQLDNVLTLGTTHDIWVSIGGAGGGTDSRMTNLYLSGLTRGIKWENVNDIVRIDNIQHHNLFYSSDANVVAYMEANKIDWDCNYFDNCMASNVQFFNSYIAIKCTDATCLGNTHSLYNAQFNNVQFNLVRQALAVAASTTRVRASFANVLCQTDTEKHVYATFFELGSDNVDVDMTNVVVSNVGAALANLGAGTGGELSISGLSVDTYSSELAAQPLFGIGAGATLYLGGSIEVAGAAGAGPLYTGAGRVVYGGGQAVNAQAGTTYTIVANDRGALVTFSNASSIAVTLPQATGAFGIGWFCDIAVTGAGQVTITPTTSTINGASSFAVSKDMGIRIVSDGTNYKIARGMGSLSASDLNSGTLAAARLPAFGSGDVSFASAGGAGTIAGNAVTYAKMQQVAASSLVGNPTGSLANAQGVTLGATLAFSGAALQTAAQTGDVTTSANSFATTIANGAVSLAKMANLAANSLIGNNTGSAATPLALTAAQAKTLLAVAPGDLSGLGSGVATLLGTFSSANLASALTDEVGSGNALFGVTTTSWTPAITFGGGSTGLTYSSRSGYYVKLGTHIYAIFDIRLSAKGSSTGSMNITGLPATIASINAQGSVTYYSGMSSITGQLTLSGSTSGTIIDFVSIGGSSAIAAATDANATNSMILIGWIGYFI